MAGLWQRLTSVFGRAQTPDSAPPTPPAVDEAALRAQLETPCLKLGVGGFRPSGDLTASCFGEIRAGLSGEPWPMHKGVPMWPLCQLNLVDAAWRPDALADLALITVWIAQDHMTANYMVIDMTDPFDLVAPFFVRGYPSLDGLVAVEAPETSSDMRAFEAAWAAEAEPDYPNHDLAYDLPEHVDIYAYDWCRVANGTKLGGWPATIQSEPWWMYRAEGAEFDYVLQIDTEEKARWMWGDSGSGYLARSRVNPNRWALDFQFY